MEQKLEQAIASMQEMMERLVTECPWNREQTAETIAAYAPGEGEELIAAVASGKEADIRDELGDLLYQILFQVELAKKRGAGWGLSEVIEGMVKKMTERHPHVFAGEKAETAADVIPIWQRVKAEQKKRKLELESE
ncbi:MAG: hypothetical protein KF916_02230 [Microbacteriaceae bacterium]|nr:hypothetical protein [Microbacteriaceae bacterium]